MYLSEPERAAGRENFHAAIGSDYKGSAGTSRREFLKAAIAAGLAAPGGLAAYSFGYGPVPQPVRVGLIGTGDQGGVLIGAANPQFLTVKAICDLRPYNLHRAFYGDSSSAMALQARCGLMQRYGWSTQDEARRHVQVYEDYQELLRDEALEAVIVALPNHLHAPVAIAAMQAGKHVFVEKPMADSVRACKEMVRVSEMTRLLLATGYQRHYSVIYDNVADLLRRGELGQVHGFQSQWHRYNMPGMDSWQPPLPPGVNPRDAMAGRLTQMLASYRRSLARAQGTDVDLWVRRVTQLEAQISDQSVDAGKHGYQQHQINDNNGNVIYECSPLEELIRWRLWHRTGGGLMAELGGHQIDAVGLFLSAANEGQPVHPLSVSASSARPLFPPDREVDDHCYCTIDFPARDYDAQDIHARRKMISMQCSVVTGNGFSGYGETVLGTEGTLIVERETEALLFGRFARTDKIRVVNDSDGPKLQRAPDGDHVSAAVGNMATVEASRGYTEQLEHWAWCIRHPAPENQPRCNPQIALANAVVTQVTELSTKTRRRIDFAQPWFDPHSDDTPEGT